MARIARVVVPGLPHHVTQRGNRRQPIFFLEEDYREYVRLMAASCKRCARIGLGRVPVPIFAVKTMDWSRSVRCWPSSVIGESTYSSRPVK